MGADLRNANLTSAMDFLSASLNSSTVYNQWTVFPPDFDPLGAGLTLIPSPAGDFDANDNLDVDDLDSLVDRILWRYGPRPGWWLPNAAFDFNHDQTVDQNDVGIWVKGLKDTWFGDANLDGRFDRLDLVSLLQAGQYDDGVPGNSTWATGDWNSDGDFDRTDLVLALQDGGYGQGPRRAFAAVPEPEGLVLVLLGIALLAAFDLSGDRIIDPQDRRIGVGG